MKIVKSKKIWILILSIITTFCAGINVVNGDITFDGNNFFWVVLVVVLCVLYDNALNKYNKRLAICSGIYSFIISCFFIAGYGASIPNFPVCKKDLLLIVCKFELCFALIMPIMMILIYNTPKAIEKIKGIREFNFFTSNKKSIIFVAIIIFLAYIPYILNFYPGSVLIDSVIQILQGQGAIKLTNHHPVLHTAIITVCMNIGKGIFDSYQTGAFIYTLVQTIATSLIFSFTIYYMARKKVPTIIRLLAVLFYMFSPTICFYTITMYKDIPFALTILLVTIGLTELSTNTAKFFKSKFKIAFLMIAITLSMFFRNNGVYAIILTFPFILISLKKYYKKILLIFLIPIIFYKIISGPVYGLLNIEQGSTKEALSVPLQQFARLMSYRSDELTEEEKSKIKQYLPIDNFEELYQPGFADPIKSNFSEEGFAQDKMGLIKLYINLAFRFPVETINSFICGSYGYYYPNTVGWGIYTGVNSEQFGEYDEYKFKRCPIIEIDFLDKLNTFVNTRDIPIISMILSIGFLFWLIVACMFYNIYNKEYRKNAIFLPVIFIWLTALASPVFCEPRYVYSIFTCLPLLFGITLTNGFKNELDGKDRYNNFECKQKTKKGD